MQKRIIKTAVCMIISFALIIIPTLSFAMEFSDVPITASYYKAVDKLSNEGVIQGRGDGAFSPNDMTTRAEFCAFVARANNFNQSYYKATQLPFKDVKSGNWAECYISYCYENGYVNGMDAESFAPGDNVTCEQAIKMVVCASGLGDESLSKVGPKWYSGYINIAKKNNLLDGVEVKIGESASRAFVAQLVYNSMLVKGTDKESQPVDISGGNTGRENGKTPTVSYVEEIWEPTSEKDLYQYYGSSEDMKEAENGDNYVLPEDKENSYVHVPKGSSDGMLIVIDAGHNYSTVDTGAVGNGLREQDVTYYIAAELEERLIANGFQVIMTRESLKENVSTESVSESLKRRYEIANRSGADLFVSIHCNAGGGSGTETYYCVGSGAGKVLAGFVQDALVDAVGLNDRGVKSARYAVLRNTLMPSVLVETAFIDNASDAAYLASEKHHKEFAEGIARGVCEFVGIEYKK